MEESNSVIPAAPALRPFDCAQGRAEAPIARGFFLTWLKLCPSGLGGVRGGEWNGYAPTLCGEAAKDGAPEPLGGG